MASALFSSHKSDMIPYMYICFLHCKMNAQIPQKNLGSSQAGGTDGHTLAVLLS